MRQALQNVPQVNGESNRRHSNFLIQRKCSCGSASRLSGNCESCNKEKLVGLQPKLSIGALNDKYEQDADRIADQVMSIQGNTHIESGPLRIQRYSHSGNKRSGDVPDSVNEILSNPGRPLDQDIKKDMEERFGYDFSFVRIHTGHGAARSAQEINAKAYTAGSNIVFARDSYSPASNDGKHLIAHELTHFIQQNETSTLSSIQKKPVNSPVNHTQSTSNIIIQRQEGSPQTESNELDSSGGTATSSPESAGQLEIVRPGSEPRILISCADMRFKIVTPSTIYSYRLEECSIPINSYVATVSITGDDFYLNFGDSVSTEEEFSFRYHVDPGQENPATLLEDIVRIQVDVVENLVAPNTNTEEERPTPPTSCVVRLADRELVPSDSMSRALFETKSFEQTIWAHPIPLGQFGWVEVEASAAGNLSGNLNGSYGPGRLTDICLTHMIDRNSSTTEIDHPLLRSGSAATVTTFGLGGHARFRLPARAAASLSASGSLRIAGDYLSVIELAAAEATLSANAIANLGGTIDASVEIVARATLSEAYLENNIPFVPGLPSTYIPSILPDITIENITLDGVDLAAEIGLRGRAGVSFRGDLSAGFDLAGINLWSQTWNLVNFDAGVSWYGGLRYSPNPGIHWDLGIFNVGEDIDPLSTDTNYEAADIDEEDIIEAILSETQSQVASPDGSNQSNALPFDWFKPDSLYPSEMNLPNAIAPTSVGRFDGPTTVRFPTALLPSRDRRHYGLPRSAASDTRTELEEDIGVADWPSVNRTFQYMPYDSRSDPEKERFKRLVDALGFDRSGFDADHIWELGLQGAEFDRFDNLWPGSNQEQQLAGSRHFQQMANYQNTLENINGRWFVISRILHPA